MKSTRIKDLFTEHDVQYRIPIYHRSYVWNERNWRQLWEDIKEKSGFRLKGDSVKPHFTGIIVIREEESTREIVDGQQRLTTFQIILCAIRDICKTFDNDTLDIAARVNTFIYNNSTPIAQSSPPSESDERYKLLPREGSDRDEFQALIDSKEVETEESDARKRHRRERPKIEPPWIESIHSAYVYFRNEIGVSVDNTYDNLHNLLECVLNDFVVFQLTVDSDDDPEQIFQTINSTGQELYEFDLLRTNLFLRVRGASTRDALYREYWYHFEADPFWHEKDVVDYFFESFLMSKQSNYLHFKRKDVKYLGYRRDPRANELSLFDEYQDYRRELPEKLNLDRDDPQLIEHEFRELDRYARVYQEIRDPDSEIGGRLTFYDDDYEGIHDYISRSFRNCLKQFILYIKNELGISENRLTPFFNFIESLVVRSVLCTGEKVGRREYHYSPEDKILRAIFGSSPYNSIFSYVERLLLESVLFVNMVGGIIDIYSPRNLDTENQFDELEIFPPEVVEEALRNCHYPFRRGAKNPNDFDDKDGYLDAVIDWGSFVHKILYQIELTVAKERGLTEADFDDMRDHFYIRHKSLPVLLTEDEDIGTMTPLYEHHPGGIGNLTVCPNLWNISEIREVNTNEIRVWDMNETRVWDANKVRERAEKLIECFNKRWPSLQDCLDEMNRAKCELISTYEGTKELSEITVHDTEIEGVDCNSNQRIVLDKHNILFACLAMKWHTVKPDIQENEIVKGQALGPIQSPAQKFQVKHEMLKTYQRAVAVTRSGDVLCGKVILFNEDIICIEINETKVMVFQHGLHEFQTMEQFKVEIKAFIQDLQRKDHGVIEFLEESKNQEDEKPKNDERFAELFGGNPRKISVHISQCPDKDFHSLQPGQWIEFNIAQTQDGLYARNITLFSSKTIEERENQPRRSARGRGRRRRRGR